MATNSNSPKIRGGKRKKSKGEKLEIAKRLKVWDHSEIQRESLIPEAPRRNLLVINPLMSPSSYTPPTLHNPPLEHIMNQRSIQDRTPPTLHNPPLEHIMNQRSIQDRTLNGPISILWDMENCQVPNDVRPEDASGNIRMALRVHPIINGAVTMFSAYGDFNSFPRKLREGCQRTGVNLIDIPNGRKDAADKAILVDMFLFALDNPPPSSIMLISGDVDFSHALHVLGQRGYTVILVVPSNGVVSPALSSAGKFVWDWNSVVRGEGFVPPAPIEISAPRVDTHENEVGPTVYKGVSKSCLSGPDMNGLKMQIVELVESCGGIVPLVRLTQVYQKRYGRPLCVSEYGANKLVNLLEKMDDVVSVEGNSETRTICLCGLKEGKGEDNDIIDLTTEDIYEEEKVDKYDDNLNRFRYELMDMLASYSCGIYLGFFEEIYYKRYNRHLDYGRFGVSQLVELLEKVKDLAVVGEELVSKRKFVFAV